MLQKRGRHRQDGRNAGSPVGNAIRSPRDPPTAPQQPLLSSEVVFILKIGFSLFLLAYNRSMFAQPFPSTDSSVVAVSGEIESEDGFNVLDAALPKNLADPRDKGKNPKTVQRNCTNVAWICPFLALLGVCCWITRIAVRVGKPAIMFRPPNFQGELCGKRRYHGMKFLYFCLRQESQASKSLEIRYPICVKDCPDSSNTSRSCYTGKGEASDVHAWQSTHDYPTQPSMYFCRPHREYTTGLSDDFWTAVSKGPPTSYFVAAHYSGWPEVSTVSISTSTLFSLFYLMLLSKYSRTFIWLSLTVLVLFAAATFCVYGYCFKEGCQLWTGQGARAFAGLVQMCRCWHLWLLPPADHEQFALRSGYGRAHLGDGMLLHSVRPCHSCPARRGPGSADLLGGLAFLRASLLVWLPGPRHFDRSREPLDIHVVQVSRN